MVYDKISNIFGEAIVRTAGGCMLDANNVVWKLIDGKWIGKRSVWTFDFRSCWLEDTTIENVKSWWCCGKDADYTEIFYRDEMQHLPLTNGLPKLYIKTFGNLPKYKYITDIKQITKWKTINENLPINMQKC